VYIGAILKDKIIALFWL